MGQAAENFSQSHDENECAEYTGLVPLDKTTPFPCHEGRKLCVFTLVIPASITVASYTQISAEVV